MQIYSLLTTAVLLSASLLARADTLRPYTLNATLADGGTISGTLEIDTTNIAGSTINFSLHDGGTTRVVSEVLTSYGDGDGDLFAFGLGYGADEITLAVPATSPATFYDGQFQGGIYTDANPYNSPYGPLVSQYFSANSIIDFASGTLTPAVATTPEPAGLALLSTGLLGVAGVVRRRSTTSR